MAETSKKMDRNVENKVEEKTNAYREVLEKQRKKEEKKERKRKKEVDEKANFIKEDLKNQLYTQNKYGKHFDDMIEDYIYFFKLKEELQNDINKNGLRYQSMTGNGYITNKPNESVQSLIKVNMQMLKILQDLDLKEPEEDPPKVGDGDDLL